jgi:hypothetical protein
MKTVMMGGGLDTISRLARGGPRAAQLECVMVICELLGNKEFCSVEEWVTQASRSLLELLEQDREGTGRDSPVQTIAVTGMFNLSCSDIGAAVLIQHRGAAALLRHGMRSALTDAPVRLYCAKAVFHMSIVNDMKLRSSLLADPNILRDIAALLRTALSAESLALLPRMEGKREETGEGGRRPSFCGGESALAKRPSQTLTLTPELDKAAGQVSARSEPTDITKGLQGRVQTRGVTLPGPINTVVGKGCPDVHCVANLVAAAYSLAGCPGGKVAVCGESQLLNLLLAARNESSPLIRNLCAALFCRLSCEYVERQSDRETQRFTERDKKSKRGETEIGNMKDRREERRERRMVHPSLPTYTYTYPRSLLNLTLHPPPLSPPYLTVNSLPISLGRPTWGCFATRSSFSSAARPRTNRRQTRCRRT